MSGKAKNKGSLHYDTHTNTVMTAEDEIDEQAKHKVSRVLEICPSVNKEEIILVLQHFAYDEASTVNAFMENRVADILKDWRKTGTKPNTKPKKKKNKKKKGQASVVSEETENSSDNSHNIGDEQLIPSQEETYQSNQNEKKVSDNLEEVPPADVPLLPKEVEAEGVIESVAESGTQKSSTCSSPRSEAAKHQSAGSSRTASFSEDTSRHSTPLSSISSYPAGQGKKSLERSLKDLSRQTVALQRVQNLLEDELDNSFKRIKSAIAEAQKLLEERNLQLEEEMEKVKKDARVMLNQRQELAIELKRRSERAATMTEAELNDLRADIKHFVVERKYDEELGKTTRFVWDKDRITQEIKAFGEIAHVKNCYSQRRQSTSSVASSLNVTTPTHSDPLGTLASENPLDSAGTSAPEDAIEQKDYRQQGGSRTLMFFGRNYSNSRPDYRSYHSGGGGGRRRGWVQPMGRRDDRYWNQQPRFHKYPYQQRVYNNETAEGEAKPQSTEHRPPYRGNRTPHYRDQGRASHHDNYNRGRHPSKDLQMNGEALKPADSSNIANGFVAH